MLLQTLLYPCESVWSPHSSAGWCLSAPYRKEVGHRSEPCFPSAETVCVSVQSEVAVYDHVNSVCVCLCVSPGRKLRQELIITYVSSRSSTNASTAELRKAATTATVRGDGQHAGVGVNKSFTVYYSPLQPSEPHDWSITG